MKRLWGSAPWLAVAFGLAGCAALQPESSTQSTTALRDYWPSRRDYAAFRAAHPDLLEPNYLPFMSHRFSSDDPLGDALVLCRWPASAMPLQFYVDSPVIPESLQDEFAPVDAERYVEAVEAAIAKWERELEGLVTFERVPNVEDADIELQLVAEEGPEEFDRRQLGGVSFSNACQIDGEDPV